MKTLLLLLFVSLLVIGAKAQNGFTTYTASLPDIPNLGNKQTSIVVDNANNVWMGYNATLASAGRLVKYNSTSQIYTVYSTTSTPSISNNRITCLTKDATGTIWIGTYGGVIKYDGVNFTTVGLGTTIINCIEAIGNQIYVGANTGLYRYDGISFTNYNVANGLLPNDNVKLIKAENANKLWIGNTTTQLVQFNIDNSFSVTSYSNVQLPIISGVISALYLDGQNNKWIAVLDNILNYNGTTFTNLRDNYNFVGNITTVTDIIKGPNNGVSFKYGYLSTPEKYGIVEIISANTINYYVQSVSTFTNLGDKLYNNNNELYITGYSSSISGNPNVKFHKFNPQSYQLPLGLITSENYKFLDINQVKAGISNRSDMHWDMGGSGNASYEVPKGKNIHSNFASALWIGGYDASNQLHIGAQTYRQNGVDFWPGPVDYVTGTTDSATAKLYDKIWKVNNTDINDFITNFNNGNVQNGTYTIPENIATWPAFSSGANTMALAPFVDYNNDGAYNPLLGDYPQIKGDQTLFFIYNDALAPHTATGGLSLGVEIQVMAYAYGNCSATLQNNPELNYTTFYNYKIINRSSNYYSNAYVTMWSDVDLGAYEDDYIGCNVKDGYGYAYNGDNDDQGAGTIGYGNYPPAQGIVILKSVQNTINATDDDYDGQVDEFGEEMRLTNFNYFNNNTGSVPANTTNPTISSEYYNCMTSNWKDGTPLTCGGNGYGSSTPTKWAYTGDPLNMSLNTDPNNQCSYWTEASASNTPGDRRMILGTGPISLLPGAVYEFEYAFVTSFDSTQANMPLLSVGKLKTDIQKIRTFYEQTNKPNCLQAITVGINELVKQKDFNVYPNPSIGILNIECQMVNQHVTYELIDIVGNVIMKNNSSQQKFTIDMSPLSSGVYFVKLTINNSSVVKKVVKQ